MLKTPKIRSEKHRRWIAELPCCVTGRIGETQCAHIRTGNGAGLGLKSGDDACVPLSWKEHQNQHSMSERKYWGNRLEAVQVLAKRLYEVSGNTKEALKAIDVFKWEALGNK